MPDRKMPSYPSMKSQALSNKLPQKTSSRFVQHPYDDFYEENGYGGGKRTLPTNRKTEELDSGYAWVVCCAASLTYAMTDGICFSLGIFFPVFLEKFKESAGFTSWISSILLGSMLLSGPLVSFLVGRFGARLICFLGAVLAASGCVISMTATGVWYLIGSLGCLTGFGFGCMMIPALVSVMTWFDQRRPLAVGIAICGAGMGMFLYSALVNLLLEHYELNGCFLILGAIILNGCIFGLLLRPAPQPAIANQNKISLPEKKNTFDLALFRNWKYDVFLLACFLFALGYFPVFIFVTSRVKQDLHWSHNEAAFLLTIIGMSNVGGRLMCAVLLGQACLNKLTTMAFGILVGATAVSLSFLCVDYTTMVLFSVFYGLSGGFSLVAMPVVMPELVAPQHVEISSGFFVFSLGLAALLGIPSAGTLVDMSGGNFTLLFLISGSSICSSSVLFAGIALVSKFSKR